ncbi:alkaline phosphatase family protein [Candidatus Riflebacteria bacterium]
MEIRKIVFCLVAMLFLSTIYWQQLYEPEENLTEIILKVKTLAVKGKFEKVRDYLKQKKLTYKNATLLEIFLKICVRLEDQKNYFETLEKSYTLLKSDKNLLLLHQDVLYKFCRKFVRTNQYAKYKWLLTEYGDGLSRKMFLSLSAFFYIKTSRFSEALKYLEELERNREPGKSIFSLSDIYVQKSFCHFHLINTEKSHYFAGLAFETDPTNPHAVDIFCNNIPPSSAIPILEKFLLKNPTKRKVSVYSRLVTCYMRDNNIEKAMLTLKRAIELYPQYSSFRVEKAFLESYIRNRRKGLKKRKDFKIIIKNVPLWIEELFLSGNWTVAGQMDDTTLFQPQSLNKTNSFSYEISLNKPFEGNYYFSIFGDKELNRWYYMQEIPWLTGAELISLDFNFFRPRNVKGGEFFLKKAHKNLKPRLYIFLLDALTWNLIRPMMLKGALPFLTFLHNKGMSAIFWAPIPHTYIALKILTSNLKKQFLFMDYLFSMLQERKQDRLLPDIPLIHNILNEYQKNSRQKTLSEQLTARSISCLDLVFYNFKFPETDSKIIEGQNKRKNFKQEQLLYAEKLSREVEFRFVYLDSVLARKDFDFIYFYENETDYLGHNFWAGYKQSLPPFDRRLPGWNVLTDIYKLIDSKVREICLKYATQKDTILIISDHGMKNGFQHGKRGFFLGFGPGLKPAMSEKSINQYDFCNMVLSFFERGRKFQVDR